MIPIKYLFLFSFISLSNISLSAQDSLKRDTIRHVDLEQVVVHGQNRVDRTNNYTFTKLDAKAVGSVVGETDVLRYISTLPGVSQGMEGGMSLFVRGGNGGHNRIEMDGVPIFGATHLFGLFSVFHPDIVDAVDFRCGHFAASSGDYLASLTRIKTIKPDTINHGSISLSPYIAGVAFSGPVTSNCGFAIAGRLSLLPLEYKAAKSIADLDADIVPKVGDLYAKTQWNLTSAHKLFASGYLSSDYFKFAQDNIIELGWGNQFGQLTWDWILSHSLSLKTQLYISNFYSEQKNRYYTDGELMSGLKLRSSLTEYACQTSLHYVINTISIDIGSKFSQQQFNPVSEKLIVSQSGTSNLDDAIYHSSLISPYADFNININNISLSLGLRGNRFGDGLSSSWDLNSHAAIGIEFYEHIGLEMSYDKLSQYRHVLEGLPVGWSLDLIVPAGKNLKPETSEQVYVGTYWMPNHLVLKLGAYYKYLSNLVSYKNSTNVFGANNTSWEEETVTGEGNSYGAELQVQWNQEKLKASGSYTFSRAFRTFSEINNGESFPFKFDRPHILNALVQLRTYQHGHKEHWFNLSTVLSSGHRGTIPLGVYKGIEPPYWSQQDRGIYVSPQKNQNAYSRQMMSTVNGFSFPSYFRIDLGYSFKKQTGRRIRELQFGIFNLLNRANPYLVFYEDNRWQQLSIFPITPSVRWSLTF